MHDNKKATRPLLWISVLFLAGCAAVAPNLPAITESPTSDRSTGRIVWHDLITDTPAESRKFYGELFGWTFEKPAAPIGFGDDDTYMLIRHDGQLIGGMLDANTLERGDRVSQWITVMSVADIDAAVARTKNNGGEVLTPPTDVGTRGTMAVIAGPDRAILAFLQANDGDPELEEPQVGGWLWDELWTHELQPVTEFFAAVTGLTHDDHAIDDIDDDYRVLMDGDQPRAAIIPNPFTDAVPVWVNYLRVQDPAAITARVEELGGEVLVPAQERAIGGSVAFIAGPSGAGVALQTWPLEQGEGE